MKKYLVKRVLYSLITLWVLVTLTFFMMHLLPGDPFIGNKHLSETTKAALYAKYGLDQPYIVQYGKYIMNALRGDLGTSMIYTNKTVTSMIAQAFPFSFELGLRALIFALIGGIMLGIISALNAGTKWDTFAMIIAVIGVSVPSFIMGALLQYFLGIKFSDWSQATWGIRIFPVQGWNTEMDKLLPSFVLGFGTLATISRMMRSSLLDVKGLDYIKTARSKGVSESGIVMKHMIRNAISPVLTILGPLTAALLTGAFVVENIFNIPGLGKFFVTSIQSNDYTMIAGTTMFYGLFIICCNFLVDILYMLVDPNVKLNQKKEA